MSEQQHTFAECRQDDLRKFIRENMPEGADETLFSAMAVSLQRRLRNAKVNRGEIGIVIPGFAHVSLKLELQPDKGPVGAAKKLGAN